MTYQELLALINPANAVVRTDGVSAMGDDDQVFDLSRSRVRYFIEPEASTATHSTRMNLGESLTVVATSDRVDGKYDLSNAARWHRVKFTQTGHYEVNGFSVDMPKAGKR